MTRSVASSPQTIAHLAADNENMPPARAIHDANDSVTRTTSSCAECRRSKLKCNRQVPCNACIRRGCASICPDGQMAATKGNQGLQAHAQRLEARVSDLTAEVDALKRELARDRGVACCDRKLPMFQNSDSQRGSQSETDVDETADSLWTVHIGPEGDTTYHGPSTSSECLSELLPSRRPGPSRSVHTLGLPPDIIDFAKSFPFGGDQFRINGTKSMFLPYLPPVEQARILVDQYFSSYTMLFRPITRAEADSLLTDLYEDALVRSLENFSSARLATFFLLLCFGRSRDASFLLADEDQFCTLAFAAFASDGGIMHPTIHSVQALCLMVLWKQRDHAIEWRWIISSLLVGVAKRLGLQGDCAHWISDSEEVNRRRRLLWETYCMIVTQSIIIGRPPMMSLRHISCKFPTDDEAITGEDGQPLQGFHQWKYQYTVACVSELSERIFSSQRLGYSEVLQIDSKIRLFPIPDHMQCPTLGDRGVRRAWSATPRRAMLQCMTMVARERYLLDLHKAYFTIAVRQNAANPLEHKYAPSVLAVHRAAHRMLSTLRDLCTVHPTNTSQIDSFWRACFASFVALGTLVIESPSCILAGNALEELERTYRFYQSSPSDILLPHIMELLGKLLDRARCASAASLGYPAQTALSQQTSAYLIDHLNMPLDELQVLGGGKGVVRVNHVADESHHPHALAHRQETETPGEQFGLPDLAFNQYQGDPGPLASSTTDATSRGSTPINPMFNTVPAVETHQGWYGGWGYGDEIWQM